MTTQEITKSNNEKIAAASGLTPEEVAIVKATVAKGTTDLELAYFLQVSKSYGLSPFKREVFCYKDSKNNLIVFAGRDGHLAAAQRDPRWNGIASSEVRENDEFIMDIPNGRITHTYGLGDRGKILGAYAIAKPRGCEIATIEYVEFEVYNRKFGVWTSDPAGMIKKCAEVHTLKKAYGLSGLASEYDFDIVDDRAYVRDHEDKPTNQRLAYAEELLRNSTFDHDRQAQLEREMLTYNNSELDALIDVLQLNQLDPVHETGKYSQTDLKLL